MGIGAGKASAFRRMALVVALTAATAWLAFRATRIATPADPLASLYQRGHPFTATVAALDEVAPVPRLLIAIVSVETGDIYDRATLAEVERVTRGLLEIDGVLPGTVTSLTRGFDHYQHGAGGLEIEPILGAAWPATPTEWAALKRRVAVNPRGPGRYVAYDGSATMITAEIVDIEARAAQAYTQLSEAERRAVSPVQHRRRAKQAFQRELVRGLAALDAAPRPPGHTLHFMGADVIEAELTAMGTRQVPIVVGSMLAIVAGTLGIGLGRTRRALGPAVAAALSLAWTLGLGSIAGIELNPMAFPFPVLLGLFTLALTAPAFAAPPRHAAIATTLATLAVALAVLALAPIPAVSGLGRLGLVWVLGMALLSRFVVPALRAWLGTEERAGGARRGTSLVERATTAAARWVPRLPRSAWLAGLGALLVAGAVAAGRLEVGGNVPGASYLAANHPWNRCFALFARKFMGPYQLSIDVVAHAPGGALDPELLREMAALGEHLTAETGARDGIGLHTMISSARFMLMDGNPKWLTLPTSAEESRRLGALVMREGQARGFADPSFTHAVVTPFFPAAGRAALDAYLASIRDYLNTHPSRLASFRLAGGLLGSTRVLDDGTTHLYRSSLAWTWVAVVAMAWASARSLAATVRAVAPLAAAQALFCIALDATGTPVSLPLAIVAGPSLAFGMCLVEARGAASPALPTTGLGALLIGAAALPWWSVGLAFQRAMVVDAAAVIVLEGSCAWLASVVLAARGGPSS